MAIRLPSTIAHAKQIMMKLQSSQTKKGYLAVYVGEIQKKRFLVPISYLNHPTFLALLQRSEDEFGFQHPMGGLTIPCKEETFLHLTSSLN
ncbi:auxin-responsive protein SAUR21-like [Impatiens glandulifera]|uniref:auxin-responsive protein SAUR21-like n=1 Tax=Impatiens glandulifera TaxID=253017 RepID=UPI001FB171BC|nr:auxin-responsive protein SAUR21-like [Impatiens glandulifera]